MGASAKTWADVKELKTRKKKLLVDMRGLYAKAETEKRELATEEQSSFDKMSEEVMAMGTRIDNLEKMMDVDDDGDDEERNEDEDKEKKKLKDDEEERSLKGNPSRGGGLHHATHRERRSTKEYRKAVADYILHRKESRTLQVDVDAKGGFLVLPTQMSNAILKAVDDMLPMLEKCTILTLDNATSLGIPTLEDSGADSEWTTEIAPITEDTTIRFGKRTLTPTPLRKRTLVSERLLRMALTLPFTSSDDTASASGLRGEPSAMLENRLAYTTSRTIEKAIMTGNGVGRPLGIFVASTRGISTARDVRTGSATGITWPALFDLKYSLKTQYHNKAEWFFNKAFMRRVLQLSSANTLVPILDANTLPRTPDTLLEMPINMSEFAPSTFTNDSYVAMLCDPRYYYVARSQEISVKVLNELYAETGRVGFIVSAEADGMPVLEEAFARFQCGT